MRKKRKTRENEKDQQEYKERKKTLVSCAELLQEKKFQNKNQGKVGKGNKKTFWKKEKNFLKGYINKRKSL